LVLTQQLKIGVDGSVVLMKNNIINILHNGDKITCSFGTTSSNDAGFWKYKAKIPITIKYEGWFGKKYSQEQDLIIIDSDSFTGFMWGE
jgi:hypothetical protein